MVKRSKRPPFENLYVFPGGKIDESDKHLNIYKIIAIPLMINWHLQSLE